MPKIIITRKFGHCEDGINAVEYLPSDEPQEVSERCAEVALQEGWAKLPLEPKSEPGRQSQDSGPEKPSSSQPAGQASRRQTLRSSGVGRGSSS